MLRALDDNIWTIERPYRNLGLTFASRMTVIRIAGGAGGASDAHGVLWLHSPVALTEDLGRSLDALGRVRHVIAPSRMHHLFCHDYQRAYPAASLWGAPGLAAKRPDLRFAGELSDRAPEAWAGTIDQALVAGVPALNELAFLHRSSGTLIVTDLVANGAADDPAALRLWLRLNGAYGRLSTPRAIRLLCRDREAARRSMERIMTWAFDRVVPGHGAIVTTGGKTVMGDAFAWLG